jgi:hypothetical protein
MTSSAATCVRHAAAPLKILSQCTASQVTQHARRSLALTVAAHCCFAVPHGPCFGIPFQIGVGEGIMRLMVNDFRCMLPLLNSLLNTLPNSVLPLNTPQCPPLRCRSFSHFWSLCCALGSQVSTYAEACRLFTRDYPRDVEILKRLVPASFFQSSPKARYLDSPLTCLL